MLKILNLLVKLVPVFYKDLDSSIKGRSKGLWIEIQNKYKNDFGLLAHERVHCRQFLKFSLLGLILSISLLFTPYNIFFAIPLILISLHGLLYTYSKTYKYKSEVEAFGYSVLYGNRSKENVKESLKTFYNIPDSIMKNFESDFKKSLENAKKDLDFLAKK